MKKLMVFLLGGGLWLTSSVGHAISSLEAGVGSFRSSASAAFRSVSPDDSGNFIAAKSSMLSSVRADMGAPLDRIAMKFNVQFSEVSFVQTGTMDNPGTDGIKLSYKIACEGCGSSISEIDNEIGTELAKALKKAQDDFDASLPKRESASSGCNTSAPGVLVLFFAALFYVVRRVWGWRSSGK